MDAREKVKGNMLYLLQLLGNVLEMGVVRSVWEWDDEWLATRNSSLGRQTTNV